MEKPLHKPRKYGTQPDFHAQPKTCAAYPLLGRPKVDHWRAEVGFGPLADCAPLVGTVFTPKKK